jgi:membrane protease YdiL (CAAX protease family)
VVFSFFFTSENFTPNQFSFLSQIILLTLIGPLLETFIFQHIIYKILKKYKPIIILLVSATLFGLAHIGNLYDFIISFIVGILYMNLYLIIKVDKHKDPFLYVLIAHVTHNLIVVIVNYIFM